MPYIFLDESGQFSKYSNKNYFIVASFTVGNVRRTAKGFRAWLRGHFPRKMRDLSEIKWASTGFSDALRLKTLREISKLDVRIHFAYLLHRNIPAEYHHKNKLQSGLLYTNIVGEILTSYLPTTDKEFRVFCDRRRLSGMSETEFKEVLKARLLPSLPKGVVLQIEMVDSTAVVNIQIADWIAGALARYLEKGKLGEECFKILKKNIIGKGRELFNGKSIII
ncbi:MAG: DUF3800 domain-containing protein [Candidatus Paceibacterota bacterium]|jgi:hypothetical protein